ncbi:hypothetical protein [Mucilaginibacter paludis]|uniref:Uncharacterized protein n=1 Tax=Mucilaginibacter paludis DSM 18603 TaxID=714943 RepID=H1Y5P4_9SPHI|nr:hypothetical protein [Mucilaginibacter paludis]EHQ29820.1 hypothetical protein Mucpa_5752 [Mucilaginibacter paludis DSM 18603]
MDILKIADDEIILKLNRHELSLVALATDAVSNQFEDISEYLLDYTEQDVEKLADDFSYVNKQYAKKISNEDSL